MLQEDTTTGLAANFLLKYPTLRALQETRPHHVRQFFLGQGRRQTVGLEERLERIKSAVGVSTQASWNNPNRFMACSVAEQLKALIAHRPNQRAHPHPGRATYQLRS